MFSGIIKKTGTIKKISYKSNGFYVGIKSSLHLFKKDIGSSVSCSGVCLTLEKIVSKIYFFYLSEETLKISNTSLFFWTAPKPPCCKSFAEKAMLGVPKLDNVAETFKLTM